MKSERRHELQHNELADWLIKTAEAIRPYQNTIWTVVIVVLLSMLGYTWWSRASAAQTAQAWEEINSAVETGALEKLSDIAENYPNTKAAQMAAVVLADYHLADGCNRLFINKAMAQQSLNKAIELYQSILSQSSIPSLLERATFGLARAKESKGEADELKRAEQLYEESLAKWPEGTFAAASRQRLEDLRRPTTKKLYDDFRNFDPKPAFSSEPGERPSFDLDSLPDEAPSSISEFPADLKQDGDK